MRFDYSEGAELILLATKAVRILLGTKEAGAELRYFGRRTQQGYRALALRITHILARFGRRRHAYHARRFRDVTRLVHGVDQ